MKSKINTLLASVKKSKDGKVLASNFGYMMLLQIASYIFPLITIPYLARIIGVDGFGKIAFSAAVIVWFQTITDWGFNYTATRDVARNKEDKKQLAVILTRVLTAKVFLLLISGAVLSLLISFIPVFKVNEKILTITFLTIVGNILFVDWFFQGIEKMKYLTVFNVISKVIFTLLVFLFIKEESDYYLQPLFMALGNAFVGVGSLYMIIAQQGLRLKLKYTVGFHETILNSSNIFINNIVPNFYNSFSGVLLGIYSGGLSMSNGLFDAGSKFVGVAQQFMLVVARVFFPFFSRTNKKHEVYAVFSLLAAVIFSFLLYAFAKEIVSFFYTDEFNPAVDVLRVLSITVIFTTLTNVYGVNYLIVNGHDKVLRRITVTCSLLGFLFSFPLVYLYSYMGAAFTVAFSRFLIGSVVAYTALKIINKGS